MYIHTVPVELEIPNDKHMEFPLARNIRYLGVIDSHFKKACPKIDWHRVVRAETFLWLVVEIRYSRASMGPLLYIAPGILILPPSKGFQGWYVRMGTHGHRATGSEQGPHNLLIF
jgi:hypothetical protein